MAGTRSSQRLNSSPQSETGTAGTKRKAEDASPPSAGKAKRGRPYKAGKEQKTIEDTLPVTEEKADDGDVEVKDAPPAEEANGGGEGGSSALPTCDLAD